MNKGPSRGIRLIGVILAYYFTARIGASLGGWGWSVALFLVGGAVGWYSPQIADWISGDR